MFSITDYFQCAVKPFKQSSSKSGYYFSQITRQDFALFLSLIMSFGMKLKIFTTPLLRVVALCFSSLPKPVLVTGKTQTNPRLNIKRPRS